MSKHQGIQTVTCILLSTLNQIFYSETWEQKETQQKVGNFAARLWKEQKVWKGPGSNHLEKLLAQIFFFKGESSWFESGQ